MMAMGSIVARSLRGGPRLKASTALERLQGDDLSHLDSLEVCRLTLDLFSSPASCLDSPL